MLRRNSSETDVPTTSVTTRIVYTATESVTLVRIMLRIWAHALATSDVDIDTMMQYTISLQPAGASTVIPTTVDRLDQDVPTLEIIRDIISVHQNAALNYGLGGTNFHDIKAKRKMKKGDEIAMKIVNDQSSVLNVRWAMSIWLLE